MSISRETRAGVGLPLPAPLRSLVDRLWDVGEEGSGPPVVVTTGPVPPTHVAVESYVVLPSLARARFLLPVRAPRAVASAFTRHLTTPSARARLVGAGLAAGFQARAGDKLFRDRLVVCIDRRIPRQDYPRWLLLQRLSEELDVPDLLAVHPVRPAVPSSKPTLRLFDRGGTARGYVKVGWSESVRRMVRTEAAALRDLDGGVPGVRVPRLMASGHWRDHEYLVASPLEPGLRPWTVPPDRMPMAMLRVARTGDVGTSTFRHSRLRDSIARRLDRAASTEAEAVTALRGWLHRLEADETALAVGRWHGDWVSWNLADLHGEAVAWDWEYSARAVPLGFDMLHWSFQHRLAGQGVDLEIAAKTLDESVPRLGSLGVPPGSHRLVGSLYLLEMLTRAVSLAAEGNGWNPKLYPSLLRVAARRDPVS